ncbi:MAG TPA: AAA family ATPase [Candidatus Paceibacterota bacterium]
MARIINICNEKGGVGKTTTAINLSAYLAALGKYVLLVDLDPQANTTGGLGVKMQDDHLSIYHSLVGDTSPGSYLRKTSIFGFDLLPASADLAGASVELVSLESREFRLKKALNSIRTHYDYILIDSPPSLGLLTINGLAAAEEIIIPVQCEYFALEGLGTLLKTIDLVRESLNPQLKIAGVLLTMYDRRNRLARAVVREVQKNFPGRVFEAIIPRSISLAEAPSFGKTILQFDPDSKAGRAYRQLAEEVSRLVV